MTIAAASLDSRILAAAGVRAGTPVEGVAPGCEFQRRILNDETVLDFAEAERDVVGAARRLVEREPSITDIVLESTNTPPYRAAVAVATHRPVQDIETSLIPQWRAAA